MKVVVIGANGTIGKAVKAALEEKGHSVISVGRKSGDYRADIADSESLKKLFADIGTFDAVANAAGDVFPGVLESTTDEQWENSIKSKGMGQVNLVRAALPYIADKVSFTLVALSRSTRSIRLQSFALWMNTQPVRIRYQLSRRC